MKKILIILLFLTAQSVYSQFSTSYNPFRVVVLSPNYPNIYPRYKTLQQVWNVLKDSTTGTTKYFIVNVTTSTSNITDWGGQYKDSLINRNPYIKLTSFGQALNDSIVGVTTSEFNLVAGILGLNPLIAGSGLNFVANQLNLVVTNYLGNALYLDGDSLKLRVQMPLYFTPNLLGLKRYSWSGLQVNNDSGLRVLTRKPLTVWGDSTGLQYGAGLTVTNDTLVFNYHPNYFTSAGGVILVKIDSGIVNTGTGLMANPDHSRLIFNPLKAMTISNNTAGDYLQWRGDSLNVKASYQFVGNNDSLYIDFNTNHFDLVYGSSPAVNIKLDSGITSTSAGLKLYADNQRVVFTSAKKLTLPSRIAGNGLQWIGDSLNINAKYPLAITNDSIYLGYTTDLKLSGNNLQVNLDSGLTRELIAPTGGIKVLLDYITTVFTATGSIAVNSAIAGAGLIWTSGVMSIATNEFALVSNDTIRVKTSSILTWYGDSLVSGLTSNTQPYDTTGVPVFAVGKIKRIAMTFQLTGSNNDTTIVTSNNYSLTAGDKIRLTWVNGSSTMRVQRWTTAGRAWANAITVVCTGFKNERWRLSMELLQEAE